MKVSVNGEELEAISVDIDKGEAVLLLLDENGNQTYLPDGSPDTVTRRGTVEVLDRKKKDKS